MDLSVSHASRPATITSYHQYAEAYTADNDNVVLDLSCRSTHNHRPSPLPPFPLMTSSPPSSLRPAVDSLRSRRHHNRKSSAFAATSAGGRHDDHDNPLRWSVRDVIEFVSEVPGCQAYAEVYSACLHIYSSLLWHTSSIY